VPPLCRVAGLKHIKTDFEDNHPTGNTKSISRDPEKLKKKLTMLCGPGAIANAIVLMQDAHNFEMKGILIGTIGLIYLLTPEKLKKKLTGKNKNH